jgi:hypothetical protein
MILTSDQFRAPTNVSQSDPSATPVTSSPKIMATTS